MKKINLTTLVSLLIILFSFTISNAMDNNQLSVVVERNNQEIKVTEVWNTVLTNKIFKRDIPINKKDLKNIKFEKTFPSNEVITYNEKYSKIKNVTSLKINLNETDLNGVNIITLNYNINLDNTTSEEFIKALPNSLFNDGSIDINNIKVTVLDNGEHKIFHYNDKTKNNITFTQKTSKSLAIDALLMILEYAIKVILVIAFCIISCIFVTFIYLHRSTNGKHKNSKRFKTKKRRKLKKKQNTKQRKLNNQRYNF